MTPPTTTRFNTTAAIQTSTSHWWFQCRWPSKARTISSPTPMMEFNANEVWPSRSRWIPASVCRRAWISRLHLHTRRRRIPTQVKRLRLLFLMRRRRTGGSKASPTYAKICSSSSWRWSHCWCQLDEKVRFDNTSLWCLYGSFVIWMAFGRDGFLDIGCLSSTSFINIIYTLGFSFFLSSNQNEKNHLTL